ncbi:MAG: phytanoyl-CoA dioxygenase family protein [Gemmatimonadetes bacterium]|nr:phytanoyl-CoA dioxygenase family protein [Gemmatimonadota bacterium]
MRFEEDGYAVMPSMVDAETIAGLIAALEAADGEGVRRRESVYAVRNLLEEVPAVRDLARSPIVRALVQAVLGPDAFAVRGLLFDKTPDANWKVTWHQDLSIAVREQKDVPGFGAWSEKAGVMHVQPPPSVLERMVTVRVHLDRCGPNNGPVNVIPGSHRGGRLMPVQVQAWRSTKAPVATCTNAGGILLMRPLLLHASSAATEPAHRRVVHLEFAADPLPCGLEWHGRW